MMHKLFLLCLTAYMSQSWRLPGRLKGGWGLGGRRRPEQKIKKYIRRLGTLIAVVVGSVTPSLLQVDSLAKVLSSPKLPKTTSCEKNAQSNPNSSATAGAVATCFVTCEGRRGAGHQP